MPSGEYGWRSGTGKCPDSYPDSPPAAVDIGLSSPTGTRFGTTSHFPEKYRRAFYAADYCAYPVTSSESETLRAAIGEGLRDPNLQED